MIIRLDQASGAPLWMQIAAQVRRQVLAARIAPGDRLPTVRELAAELRVNPNTVARAYLQLERDGVVETRRGLGTFASDAHARQTKSEKLAIVAERVDALLLEAAHLGVSAGELEAVWQERLRRFGADRVVAAAPSEVINDASR